MRFIGSFFTSDNLIITDPSQYRLPIQDIMSDVLCSPIDGIEIPVRPGTWYAYHFYGNYKYPVALILIEEEYCVANDIQYIDKNSLTEIGNINTAYGKMIAAIDKHMINNTKYIYFNNTDSTTFRLKDIRRWLKRQPLDNDSKLRKEIERLHKENEEYIDGNTFYALYNEETVPIVSDIWANDCYSRLENNPTNASPIMGGMVSRTYSDENICYADQTQVPRILYIDLNRNATKANKFHIVY